ncbi:hypothetical protein J3B02_003476, partial [Coemansia erecta]
MLRYTFSKTKNEKSGLVIASTRPRLISSLLAAANLPETLDSLEALASTLGSKKSEWTAKEEQQAKTVLFRCRQLVADSGNNNNNNSNSNNNNNNASRSASDIRKICLLADQLGSQMVQKNRTSFAPDIFVDYLDFYAALGRPDITQSAFGRIVSQWRRPSILSYAAQQRALLRFYANGSALLHKTMMEDSQDALKIVTDRLQFRSVAQIIECALEKDRRTRRFVKVLEYGSYTALAALVAKWAWIGNSVLMAGVPLLPKTFASVAALLVAAAGVRLALRHSIMGSLTSPLLSDLPDRSRSSTSSSAQLSTENDSDAFRKLRQAFPASPSDETMAEINEMISAAHSSNSMVASRTGLSWKLRLALMWSRFARRFAVVEPSMISQHELCQYLAVSWLREIAHMFVPEKHVVTDSTREISSKAVTEFVDFAQLRFKNIPLLLSHSDISAISRFVAVQADAKTVDIFLDMVAHGYLALSRDQHESEKRNQALAAVSADGFHKQQAGAAILAYCLCIQSATRMGSETSDQLYVSLQKLASSSSLPISRSLCQIAFQGALALDLLDRRQATVEALIGSLETRYQQKDPYLMHLLADNGQRIANDNTQTAPIVRCISDYIAALVRYSDAKDVCSFVVRWLQIGILSPAASEQCLLVATNMALSLPGKSQNHTRRNCPDPARLEQLADLACKIAVNFVSGHLENRSALASMALPMYTLLEKVLDAFSRSIDSECTRKCVDNVFYSLSSTVSHSPILSSHAPQEFNETAIKLLLALAFRQSEAESKGTFIKRAIRYLDLMRHLNQAPSQKTIEKLCTAAAKLNMDVSAVSSYWA